MINKIMNITLNIIIFLVPILIIPKDLNVAPYNILKISVLLICGVILLICLLLKKNIQLDKVDKALLVFYVLIILSTIFSINTITSIIGANNRYEGVLTFTVYFLTYYCAKYYFEYSKLTKYFSITTICLCSIIGILQYYNIFPLYYIFNIPFDASFASSTFGNRNFFASYLAIVVPTFMALYITKKQKSYLFVSLLSFFAIIVSMTRGAWVGIAFASILGLTYVIKHRSKDIIKRTIHIIIGFLVIFIFVLRPPQFLFNLIPKYTNLDTLNDRIDLMQTELQTAIEDKKVSKSFGSSRIEIWSMVLNIIVQSPLIGTGPDTLADAILYMDTHNAINFMLNHGCHVDKAHNEYLQIAATIGIPALIAYLVFLILICIKEKNLLSNDSTFILMIPIISYLFQAFFNISTIGVAPIFWFLLGLVQNESFKEKLL